jgi:alpha-tubulin suppressor-like RCC1 family protein
MTRRPWRACIVVVFGLAIGVLTADAQAPSRVVALGAGTDFTCLLDSSGEVRCWGRNDVGQLGRGSSDTLAHPVAARVELRGAAVALSVGRDHACALLADHSAACWGDDRMSESGATTKPEQCDDVGLVVPCRTRPVRVAGDAHFRSIAAGFRESCGISIERRVLCWGAFVDGRPRESARVDLCGGSQLRSCRRRPTLLPFLVGRQQGPPALASFDTLAIGAFASCGVAKTSVYCWGHGTDWMGIPGSVSGIAIDGVLSASMGDQHACGVHFTSVLFCWGARWLGRGDPPTKRTRREPQFHMLDSAGTFAAVSVGAMHSCAIEANTRRLFCWGANQHGQLGIGSLDRTRGAAMRDAHPQPEPVGGSLRFTQVAAGLEHTCALSTNGAVYCWGRALRGSLGENTGTVAAPMRMRLP